MKAWQSKKDSFSMTLMIHGLDILEQFVSYTTIYLHIFKF